MNFTILPAADAHCGPTMLEKRSTDCSVTVRGNVPAEHQEAPRWLLQQTAAQVEASISLLLKGWKGHSEPLHWTSVQFWIPHRESGKRYAKLVLKLTFSGGECKTPQPKTANYLKHSVLCCIYFVVKRGNQGYGKLLALLG